MIFSIKQYLIDNKLVDNFKEMNLISSDKIPDSAIIVSTEFDDTTIIILCVLINIRIIQKLDPYKSVKFFLEEILIEEHPTLSKWNLYISDEHHEYGVIFPEFTNYQLIAKTIIYLIVGMAGNNSYLAGSLKFEY